MKKVLVITYYWPPAGGISVLRTLKIVKYLRSFGWEPIVYAPSNAHYPYLDVDNVNDIPKDLEIIKHPILEPFKVFKWITGRKKDQPLNSIVQVRDRKPSLLDKLGIWIRGNFFIPDARSLWINPSVKFLTKYLSEHPVDAIFTDGPPHTNTYIANLLKKNTGIPWLSDYQDPWTQVDYYQMLSIGKRAHAIHSKMEQECFENADKVTIASPTWKKDLESIGAKNVDVIYYGYDEDDFRNLRKTVTKTFDIVHIGLMGVDRHPKEFFTIIAQLQKSHAIKLKFAGQLDVQVKDDIASLGLDVEFLGTIPRKDALQLAMDADLLLLPLNKAENAQGRLPGKLYEYLRTYNPILALGPTNGDAAAIIKESNSGVCYEYHQSEDQEKFLLERIARDASNPNQDAIAQFSNQAQTALIAEYLDQITQSNG